ncbi:MAG: DUF1176 domain-containing protein [Spirulina sp.]
MNKRLTAVILVAFLVGCTATGKNALAREEEFLEQLYDRQEKLQLCEFEFDRERSREVSQIYRVGEQKYVVELLCFMAAYQGNYEYYLIETKNSRLDIHPLMITVFNPNSSGEWTREENRDIAGLPSFDAETRILTLYSKGNGVGTCGSLARYEFDGEKFQLVNYRAKAECDDRYIEPENYPQIYPLTWTSNAEINSISDYFLQTPERYFQILNDDDANTSVRQGFLQESSAIVDTENGYISTSSIYPDLCNYEMAIFRRSRGSHWVALNVRCTIGDTF